MFALLKSSYFSCAYTVLSFRRCLQFFTKPRCQCVCKHISSKIQQLLSSNAYFALKFRLSVFVQNKSYFNFFCQKSFFVFFITLFWQNFTKKSDIFLKKSYFISDFRGLLLHTKVYSFLLINSKFCNAFTVWIQNCPKYFYWIFFK